MKKSTYSASITPLTAGGRVDGDSLARVIERNIRHGLTGVFLLGTMGEWSQLDNASRDEVIRVGTAAARGRCRVLAGIHSTGLKLTLDNMERISDAAFDAYVLTLPNGTSRLDPLEFIFTVLDRADRPVYYYHHPGVNGVRFGVEEFRRLAAHPRFAGIKNSSSDIMLRKELLAARPDPDFPILEGNEWAMDEALLLGCEGVLAGGGALCSRPMVALAAAADAGDVATMRQIQYRLLKVFHAVYGRRLDRVWCGEKYALKVLGVIASEKTLIEPEEKLLTPEARREIECAMEAHGDWLEGVEGAQVRPA